MLSDLDAKMMEASSLRRANRLIFATRKTLLWMYCHTGKRKYFNEAATIGLSNREMENSRRFHYAGDGAHVE